MTDEVYDTIIDLLLRVDPNIGPEEDINIRNDTVIRKFVKCHIYESSNYQRVIDFEEDIVEREEFPLIASAESYALAFYNTMLKHENI